MEFLILESFIKSVPKERKKEVSSCIKKLIGLKPEQIKQKQAPVGYKIEEIKSIKNKRIFKLRTNKENRMLFTYGKYVDGIRDEYKESLIFLIYSNHDNQIKKAERFNFVGKNIVRFEELKDYVEAKDEGSNKNLELCINNMISVVVDDDYVDEVFSDKQLSKIYYLDDIQKKAADQDMNGKMLFGSAGSGKTTISLYRIMKLLRSNPKMKICYVTYSNVLKKNTKENFELIGKNLIKLDEETMGKVDFYTFEEYMIKKCRVKAIANFESFNLWYEKNIKKFKTLDIPTIKIWREIRGVLTGIIGKDLFNNIEIAVEILDVIRDKKFRNIVEQFVEFKSDDVFVIKQGKSIAEFQEKIGRIDWVASQKIYKNLLNEYISYLKDSKVLNQEQYLNLKNFSSVETKQERKQLYEIAKKYFDYIEKCETESFSNFVVINNIKDNKTDYDYLIIDEMQDLTERELFYLMTGVKEKKRILFTGDFNQTINPTYFEAGRVEGIYRLYAGFTTLDKDFISKNYRSVDTIVNLSNVIAKKRNSIFVNKTDFEYLEEPVRVGDKEVLYIEGNEKNKNTFMDTVKADYSSIVIVSDNRMKQLFIKKYPFMDDRTYTISESKGIESKKVILYNIISDEKERWLDLLNRKKVTDDSLRYYFNSLYVSITRAREELILIEEKENLVFNLIEDKVKQIKEFNPKETRVIKASDEEMFEAAQQNERIEKYENAIKTYTKLLDGKYRKKVLLGIERCKILSELEKTRQVRIAIEKLIKIKELEIAKEKAQSFNIPDLYLKAILFEDKEIEKSHIEKVLNKKFSTTVSKILNEKQEIDYCDLLIKKYYKTDLSRLDNLLLSTKKISSDLRKLK